MVRMRLKRPRSDAARDLALVASADLTVIELGEIVLDAPTAGVTTGAVTIRAWRHKSRGRIVAGAHKEHRCSFVVHLGSTK
jgi:hypothetical protein